MKAVLSGRAWRTPLGGTIDGVIARLLAGERAAAPNARFDASAYACTLASTIAGQPAPSRHARFLRRMGLFAVEVAAEALADAGVQGSDRVGLFFGYGGLRAHWDDLMPAFEGQNPDGAGAWERGLTLLHPFWMLQHLSNNAHAIAAQELGARGEGATYGGANAGAQALSAAIRALAAGAVDVALVVAYDSLVEPETLIELAARNACSSAGIAALASPYTATASGFVPGEAAAALVLKRCGPGPLVQAVDGADGASGEPDPALARRLLALLAEHGDIVDGAGLAQPGYDAAERAAAAAIVGAGAPLCCIMGAMGQIGAASSIVQTIALAELLQRQVLPPLAGAPAPASGPLVARRTMQATALRAAVGLSAGAPGLGGVIRVALP